MTAQSVSHCVNGSGGQWQLPVEWHASTQLEGPAPNMCWVVDVSLYSCSCRADCGFGDLVLVGAGWRGWEECLGWLTQSMWILVGQNLMMSAGGPMLTVDFCRGKNCWVFLKSRSGWIVHHPHYMAATGGPCTSFSFLTTSIYLSFASLGGVKLEWDLGVVL